MLTIRLRASLTLAAVLLLAHAAAVALIAIIGIPLWLQLAASAALAANFAREAWNKALLRSSRSVRAIEIASDNTISVQRHGAEWVACEVRGDTFVLWFLTVLNLKRRDNGERIGIVILPDAIDTEDFRRLRVWLRWKPDKETPALK